MRLGPALRKFAHGPSPLAFLRLAAIMRRSKPDLIHTRCGQDSTWASYFHFAGRPVVRSRHMKIPERVPIRDIIGYRLCCAGKGQRTFINAADKFLRLVSDARFVIVGGGERSHVGHRTKASCSSAGGAETTTLAALRRRPFFLGQSAWHDRESVSPSFARPARRGCKRLC